MKVWICSDGSYSDYRVKAIYSSLETAKLASNALGWENDPEEFELDPALRQRIKDGLCSYCVILYFDVRGSQTATHSRKIDFDPDTVLDYWTTPRPSDGGRNFISHMWARDEEHAIKIAADRMAQVARPDFNLNLSESADKSTNENAP